MRMETRRPAAEVREGMFIRGQQRTHLSFS